MNISTIVLIVPFMELKHNRTFLNKIPKSVLIVPFMELKLLIAAVCALMTLS